MTIYAAGTSVTVQIPLVGLDGVSLTPTGFDYTIEDAEGLELLPLTSVQVDPNDEQVEITVSAILNVLVGSTGGRVILGRIHTPTGDVSVQLTYLLRTTQRLELLSNSFQSFAQAQVELMEMPTQLGWNGSTDDQRQAAMVEAFLRITRLGYRVRQPDDLDYFQFVGQIDGSSEIVEPRAWSIMTIDRWRQFPEAFRKALRRAQILETNEILRGDVVGEKRRSGILSESIGESSMMFRTGKPLSLGICSAALEALSGYIAIRMTLTRA